MGRAELFEQARALPLAERVRLADQIWDTIAAEAYDPDLTTEQLAELERRAEEFRKNPNDGTSWEEVRAELRKRHGWT